MNNSYSEVYSVLEMYGDEYVNKLPDKLYSLIKDNRNLKYNPEYDFLKPLNTQNISKEALATLTFMYLNYWCESDIVREEIERSLKENLEEKVIEQIKNIQEEQLNQEEVLNIEGVDKKVNIFTKILNKIKSIFKR